MGTELKNFYFPLELRCEDKGNVIVFKNNSRKIISSKKNILFKGDIGMGKTTILNQLKKSMGIMTKYKVCFFSFRIDNYKKVIQSIYETVNKFNAGDKKIKWKKELLLLIDNTDNLEEEDLKRLKEEIRKLKSISNVRIVITSIVDNFKELGFYKYNILPLSNKRCKKFIKYLDKIEGKKVGSLIKTLTKDGYHEAIFNNLRNTFTFLMFYAEMSTYSKIKLHLKMQETPNNPIFLFLMRNINPVIVKSTKLHLEFKKNIKSLNVINNYETKSLTFTKPYYTPTPNDLIISHFRNGLGDLLWLSHIPRIAKESGKYNRVLISDSFNGYRSKEHKYLVWELNPYVDGYCVEKPNNYLNVEALKIMEGEQLKNENILDLIMFVYRLDDGKRGHKPEIYYKPKRLNDFKNKIIYDPYYVSNSRIFPKSLFNVDKYFREKAIEVDYQMRFINDHSPAFKSEYTRIPTTRYIDQVATSSLLDFCDLLHSVKEVYCLTTGTATLADALGVKAKVLIEQGTRAHHSFDHDYINIGELSYF